MSLSTQESDEDSNYVLVARLDNARTMANILKAVHFKDTAIIFASQNGLKVTVEDAKCVQANAFLQASLFQEFVIREDQVTFKVNLTVLLDCLNIFGTSQVGGVMTALKLCYTGYGNPICLLLEENGVLTDCSLTTQDPEETLDFNFSSTNVINKIIMKSECLKEAFSELDMTSEVLQILMSPDKPHFRLSTFGSAGSSHSDFPKESDMMESFQCEKTQSNRYKISLLKPSVKALMLSSRISLRMDRRGFLSMQYMIKTDDGQVCFVEYFCAPDEMEEIDEDACS
ncbi:hypothetical protein LSH36_655g01043 [Paralvinella palmiformis]|uniref:Cell cycle checkpoint protein RAD1 n=1 Tax=Paralvinella palmiformis TaxID=53620 RepID=A0AAD9MVX8_9ANNE|nr:hypothetical protein LSH36_655g01043 [Paralvinella palmiformis]